MKAFITGGGGFLGKHIVRQLLDEGHEVTSYSRSSYPELEKWGVKSIRGDLSNSSLLESSSKDHDVFFHTASKVAMWGREKDFYQTNVIGTENVLRACQKNKISSLIYTSTPSVVFGDSSVKGGNESLPYPKKSYSRYAKSKAIAEEKVIKANDENIKTVCLRPHLIFGPGDQNLIPKILAAHKLGKLKIVGNGENKVDVLYVENAAKAHILAWKALLNKPQVVGGKAYFLGQGPVKLWEFINKIIKKHNLPPVEKKIPFKVAFRLGGLIELFSQMIGKFNYHPPMTRFVALQLSHDHYFNHSNAKKDLGWIPEIDLDEGLEKLTIS